jgi:hypothetical protein
MRLLRSALTAGVSRGALVCLAGLGACATEPEVLRFEGIITSRSDVVDVFQNTTTTYIRVDKSPGSPDVCAEQADVTVTAATFIARDATPSQQESADILDPGRVVRVLPGTDPRDVCPMMINATSVIVVGQP